MTDRRWPWLLSGLLGLLAATAVGYSTYLAWLPCPGPLVRATLLGWLSHSDAISASCFERMDTYSLYFAPNHGGDMVPGAAEYGLLGAALVGFSWLVVVAGLRCTRRTRVLAALPSLVSLAMVALGVVDLATGSVVGDGLIEWGMLLVEVAAIGAAVDLLSSAPDRSLSRRHVARVLLGLWSASAMGWLHVFADYEFLSIPDGGFWDVPPGTGYPSAAFLAISALGVIVATLWPRRPTVPGDRVEPELVPASR